MKFYTVLVSDVGKLMNPLGTVQKIDIGKRIYRNGPPSVENSEQLADRMRDTWMTMIRSIESKDDRRATYIAKKAQPRQSDTLADRCSAGVELTEQEQESLADLLGKGCHARTKSKLQLVCGWLVSRLDTWPGFARVTFKNGEASYCAGQSYPDEIRRLRKIVLS